MNFTPLTAISPVDGRYRKQVESLAGYFSEYALIRYRLMVEVEYFIALCKLPLPALAAFPAEKFSALQSLIDTFGESQALRVKEIESTTNHDVKAVENFMREWFDANGLSGFREFIHFGLTSQDINNTAVPLSLLHFVKQVYDPMLEQLTGKLESLSLEWKDIPMLAHTHGQPASPTRLGKEIAVFTERLRNQQEMLKSIPYAAKFGGATGNFNAHHVAYPQTDWAAFSNRFIGNLGLKRLHTTTQIEHYDYLAAFFDNIKRINTILIDFCRDVWTYISMEYFKQKIKAGEIGSSTMPHKVNPIDFENAEGNLGLANAMFEHLSAKLPISRLQRDLTDSTVSRNIGVPMAHSIISMKSLLKGLDKLIVNPSAIDADLEKNWAVVAEALQTILRREGFPDAYNTLKALTRTNETITRAAIQSFINGLDLPEKVKTEMRAITPQNYTGI